MAGPQFPHLEIGDNNDISYSSQEGIQLQVYLTSVALN